MHVNKKFVTFIIHNACTYINTYIYTMDVCVYVFVKCIMKANNKDNAKASYDGDCVFGGVAG